MCRMYIYQDLLLVFPLSLFILYPNSATKLARQRYRSPPQFSFGGKRKRIYGRNATTQPLVAPPLHNGRPSASLLNSTVIASMLGQVRTDTRHGVG
jgi:hypothetical protein